MKIKTFRENSRCPTVEIVALSSNDAAFDTARAYAQGDISYSSVDKRLLFAELMFVDGDKPALESKARDAVVYVYNHGLYRALLHICRLVRGPHFRAVSLPAKSKQESAHIKGRVFSACCEGVLHALSIWDSAKCGKTGDEALVALFGHCLFWVERYSAHEATVIRGESMGLAEQAEATLREVMGHKYWRLRKIAKVFDEARSVVNGEPSVLDIVETARALGVKSISVADIERFLSEHYTYDLDDLDAVDSPLPAEARADLYAVSRALKGDVPSTSGALGAHRPEDLEAYQTLVVMRDQLFAALATNHYGDNFTLTADVAEIVDVAFFSALPLEDSDYQTLASPASSLTSETLRRRLAESSLSSRWRRRVEDRLEALSTSEREFLLVIPDVADRPVKFGARSIGLVRRQPEGEPDTSTTQHLGTYRPRRYADRVALRVCVQRVLRAGIPPIEPEAHITHAEFRDVLTQVKRTLRVFTKRGYFDPASQNVLPVLAEKFRLDSGWSISAQRAPSGEPLYVMSRRGKIPMVAWTPPEASVEHCAYAPPRRASWTGTGELMERLRQEHLLRKEEKRLLRCGHLQRRTVHIRASKGPVKVVRDGHARYYTTEKRLLPRLPFCVGDTRVPGEKFSRVLPVALESPWPTSGVSSLAEKFKPSRRPYRPPERSNASAGGIPWEMGNAEQAAISRQRDAVFVVRSVWLPETAKISALSLSSPYKRMVRALRGATKVEVRSDEIR